jgi:hypothetical protein
VGKGFGTPHKRRPRRKINTDIDESDKNDSEISYY